MKSRLGKISAFVIAIIMVITAFPVYAGSADYEVIRLNVKNGSDISDEFTYAAREARYLEKGKTLKIVIPKGNYKASSQLKLWSNTYVSMNGVVITHSNSAYNMVRFGNLSDLNSSPVKGYNGFENITIEGGTLDGGGFQKAIMQIGHAKNITIRGVTFRNVKNAHMIEAGGCSNLKVENCTFKNFRGKWGTSTNYEALQFEVVTETGGHFSGYPSNKDETPCRNITVKGCTFKNLQRGIGTHTGIVNSYFDNMVFEGNTFENISGFAIIATNYINSKIVKNKIKNCGSGIMYRTVELAHSNFYPSKRKSNKHAKYVKMKSKISNNKIEVTTGYKTKYKNVAYGIQLNGEKLKKKSGTVPKGDFRCAGVTVSNNTVTLRCTGYGIWLIGSLKNTVKGNTVNCKITKKGKGGNGDGIRLQKSPNNTVVSNKIINTTKRKAAPNLCGIVFCENSYSCKAVSNVIKKVNKNGIALYGSKGAVITGNKIISSKNYGVFSDSGKKAVKKYAKNKVTGSASRARNW